MDELRAKYERQLKEYDTLIDSAIDANDISQVTKLREMNASIAKTLNEMIEKLTFLKKDTPSIKKERDELIERLTQIQKDYNGLLVTTDQLETLRRIRQQESTEANRQLYLYLGFFLLVCVVMILYLAFMTHRKDTTAPSASMPPTTAAFV
jgi:lipopolysaccharide export LptBFGC system permease protein LptF